MSPKKDAVISSKNRFQTYVAHFFLIHHSAYKINRNWTSNNFNESTNTEEKNNVPLIWGRTATAVEEIYQRTYLGGGQYNWLQ
jgi:hypothetical protein